MKKKIIVLLIAAFPLLGYNVHACDCIGKDSVPDALKKSAYVFIGKVIDVRTETISDGYINFYRKKYTFEVNAYYKGKNRKYRIIIVTGNGNGDCGFLFEIEKKYIVYAVWKRQYPPFSSKEKKFLYTDICTRTMIISNYEETILNSYSRKKSVIHRAPSNPNPQ